MNKKPSSKNPNAPIVVWLRRDLRLLDNPALNWAARQNRPVLVIYIFETTDGDDWKAGAASNWWLHYSLQSLSNSIKSTGGRLRLFKGTALKVISGVLEVSGADTVVWNRRYEPSSIQTDTSLKQQLSENQITVTSFPGNFCHEPWQVLRQEAYPYRVFTAYWRASMKHDSMSVTPATKTIRGYRGKLADEVTLASLKLRPTLKWASAFHDNWTPGEDGAADMLKRLVKEKISGYQSNRDIPSLEGTSRLSPHLAFGEISPRQINSAIRKALVGKKISEDDDTETFLREIGWREFAGHLIYHFPHTVHEPLDQRFNHIKWNKVVKKDLARWQRGNTGIPIVDAGMRQLWQTGWMHNRVRMVVGSLLIKNMGYHWLEGARWFWDTLVDADLASNTMGWQWVAGSGADAAPYFRVFNPVRQGERFDPQGHYVRQWVPEIANLDNKFIHAPWTATPQDLTAADIVLGKTYPHPIVDLSISRVEALSRFEAIKKVKK